MGDYNINPFSVESHSFTAGFMIYSHGHIPFLVLVQLSNKLASWFNPIGQAWYADNPRIKIHWNILGWWTEWFSAYLIAGTDWYAIGPNHQDLHHESCQSILSIAQLLQFKCHLNKHKDSGAVHWRVKQSCSFMLDWWLHTETRNKEPADKLYGLGLSRYMTVFSTTPANMVCK